MPTLETMVAAAQSAATSSNMQWTSVIAVSDPAKKKVLAEIAGNQKHIEQCPLFVCVRGQFEGDLHPLPPCHVLADAVCVEKR